MLDSVPIIWLVSTVLGFLSGLGIGGGSLLIVWLTLVMGFDPAVARCVNLLFFLPTALVSVLIRIRRKSLSVRPLLPAIIAGCLSAALFSVIATRLELSLLKKGFGFLLIAAGIRELTYRPRNAR